MKRKNIKKKLKKYQWIIILAITTFIAMYIYGMTEVYLPEPVHIGAGQYLDIGTGIIIVCLFFSGLVIGLIIKKKKNKNIL